MISTISTVEIDEFKTLIDEYYNAWSSALSGNGLEALDYPARFYTKDEGAIFYDPLLPLEGHRGWQKFKFDVAKVWSEAGIVSANIQRVGEVALRQYGNLAWAAVPHQAIVKLNNGQEKTVAQRQTFVWQRRDNQWLIIHEHASAAVTLGSQLPQHSDTTQKEQSSPKFKELVHHFWSAWNTRDIEIAATNYSQTPDLVVYLPWKIEGFTGWETFKPFAEGIIQNMQMVQFTPHANLHALEFNNIAVTFGTFGILMQKQDGTVTQGDARYTLIWEQQDSKWLIIHEHLSSTIN
jgi:ketosteroid isomerase-like protein